MKILYLSYENSDDIKAWSGLTKTIRDYLSLDHKIVTIDKLNKPIDVIFKLYSKLFTFFGYTTDFNRNKLFIKLVSKRINNRLKILDYDLIFAPGTLFTTYLETDKPIVVWTDATFADLVSSYPQYSNLPKWQLNAGHKLESIALNNATKVIFAASWCVKSATKYYNIEKRKLEVIPFGSNIRNNLTVDSVLELAKSKDEEKINLLFIGADWNKKGGDILINIFSELKKISDKYVLDIVGSSPKEKINIFDIHFHGFLDKSIDSENRKLKSLFQKSHYFILPTRAEAYGIVVCEANSYGIPVFANSTGGVKDTVKNGKNGELFDINNTPKEIANQIHKSIIKGNYEIKAVESFNHYEENFKWETSIEKVNELLNKLIQE